MLWFYLSLYCHASASYETASATNRPRALRRIRQRWNTQRHVVTSKSSIFSVCAFLCCFFFPLNIASCLLVTLSFSVSVFLTLYLPLSFSLSLSLTHSLSSSIFLFLSLSISLTPHMHTRTSTLPTQHKRLHTSAHQTSPRQSRCAYCAFVL